jgi:hypothetical protein
MRRAASSTGRVVIPASPLWAETAIDRPPSWSLVDLWRAAWSFADAQATEEAGLRSARSAASHAFDALLDIGGAAGSAAWEEWVLSDGVAEGRPALPNYADREGL